jgi:hypothetical protein
MELLSMKILDKLFAAEAIRGIDRLIERRSAE